MKNLIYLSLLCFSMRAICQTHPEIYISKVQRAKFENRIQELYPEKYIALYSMVSFSSIPYAEAWKKGQEQDAYMKDLMKQHDIENLMKDGKVDELIHSIFKDKKVVG